MTRIACDTALHFYGGDDIVPFRNVLDEELPPVRFMEEWNRREPVKRRFATPQEYFDDLPILSLPTVEGIHGPCEPTYKATVNGGSGCSRRWPERKARLTQAEALALLAERYGVPMLKEALDRLWARYFEITDHATKSCLRTIFTECGGFPRKTATQPRNSWRIFCGIWHSTSAATGPMCRSIPRPLRGRRRRSSIRPSPKTPTILCYGASTVARWTRS